LFREDFWTWTKESQHYNMYTTMTDIGFENVKHSMTFVESLSRCIENNVNKTIDYDILYDEKQRDHFLVKMMYILLVKRLESSWYSFHSTVGKILEHHQKALDKIKEYQNYEVSTKGNIRNIKTY
jgi:hypothetical protein